MSYNCPKCGALACGMDTSCSCWSPYTGWKNSALTDRQKTSTEPNDADIKLLKEMHIKWDA